MLLALNRITSVHDCNEICSVAGSLFLVNIKVARILHTERKYASDINYNLSMKILGNSVCQFRVGLHRLQRREVVSIIPPFSAAQNRDLFFEELAFSVLTIKE